MSPSIKLNYTGSKVALTLWLIFYFPMAIPLLLLNTELRRGEERWRYQSTMDPWLHFALALVLPIWVVVVFLGGVEFRPSTAVKAPEA